MHYLELDAEGRLAGVFPLEEEISNTEFYDGTLLLVPSDTFFPPAGSFSSEWLAFSEAVELSSSVHVYQLTGVSPATPELGTNNGGGNCHVQRL